MNANQMLDGVPGEDIESLTLMDKHEFRDATRQLVKMSDDEFETLWVRFQEEKRKRCMN